MRYPLQLQFCCTWTSSTFSASERIEDDEHKSRAFRTEYLAADGEAVIRCSTCFQSIVDANDGGARPRKGGRQLSQ